MQQPRACPGYEPTLSPRCADKAEFANRSGAGAAIVLDDGEAGFAASEALQRTPIDGMAQGLYNLRPNHKQRLMSKATVCSLASARSSWGVGVGLSLGWLAYPPNRPNGLSVEEHCSTPGNQKPASSHSCGIDATGGTWCWRSAANNNNNVLGPVASDDVDPYQPIPMEGGSSTGGRSSRSSMWP